MANTFTERITRLASKLEAYDAKIAEYTEQRNAVAAEIQELTNTYSGAKTMTTNTSRTAKPGSMGNKITNILTENPGQSADDLAKRLRVTPSRIGVSLYHLTTKGKVNKTDDKYYLSNTDTTATAEV